MIGKSFLLPTLCLSDSDIANVFTYHLVYCNMFHGLPCIVGMGIGLLVDLVPLIQVCFNEEYLIFVYFRQKLQEKFRQIVNFVIF